MGLIPSSNGPNLASEILVSCRPVLFPAFTLYLGPLWVEGPFPVLAPGGEGGETGSLPRGTHPKWPGGEGGETDCALHVPGDFPWGTPEVGPKVG